MALVDVHYLGVSSLGSQHADCLVLWWAERTRALPIWISPEAASALRKRPIWEDIYRPDAVSALVDVLNAGDDPIRELAITGQHQGTFYAEIVLDSDRKIELRPSDLVAVHMLTKLPVRVEEEVLAETSVFLPVAEVLRTFDFLVRDGEEVYLSGSYQLDETTSGVDDEPHEFGVDDEEFAAFMRELGVSDEDLT
ncbi:DUF151 domain-containing protein [Staphylococcus chromogenes]|nr:DUF151 domain-containing protein [Staphylococcus chromogenes]